MSDRRVRPPIMGGRIPFFAFWGINTRCPRSLTSDRLMKANLLAAGMPVFGAENSTRGPQSIHHQETELAMSAETGSEFERTFLPHLDAAYNLARVLIHNAPD